MRFGQLAILLLLTLVIAEPVRAQVPPPESYTDRVNALTRLFSRLELDEPIRIRIQNGSVFEGTYVDYDWRYAKIQPEIGDVRDIPLDEIAAMWFERRGWRDGSVIGANVGAVGAIGTSSVLTAFCLFLAREQSCWAMIPIAGAAGVAGGGIVGGFLGVAKPHWTLVYGQPSDRILRAERYLARPSAQGFIGITDILLGGALTLDEGPVYDVGGLMRYIVPLGEILAVGPEGGLYTFGEDDRVWHVSGAVRVSTPTDEAQFHGWLSTGYYGVQYQEEEYGGEPREGTLGFIGYRVGMGTSWHPPGTGIMITSELSFHSNVEKVETARDIEFVTGMLGLSLGW